jgi:hypothetical protein
MNIVYIHWHCIDLYHSTKLDQHIHHQLRYYILSCSLRSKVQPRTQALSTTRLAGGKTRPGWSRVSQILGDNKIFT